MHPKGITCGQWSVSFACTVEERNYMTPEIHVEELKKDPEFLANIQRLEIECKEEESIAKGYQLLDAQLIIEASEDDINEIFTFIVNTAFDRLAEKTLYRQIV